MRNADSPGAISSIVHSIKLLLSAPHSSPKGNSGLTSAEWAQKAVRSSVQSRTFAGQDRSRTLKRSKKDSFDPSGLLVPGPGDGDSSARGCARAGSSGIPEAWSPIYTFGQRA